MPVERPQDINAAFAAAVNARDLEAVLRCYAPAGMVVNPDGTTACGHDDIAHHVEGLLAMGGHMTATNEYAFVNGDVALVGARFMIEFDDDRAAIAGRTAEVLVRVEEGWAYLIDHPFALPG